MSTHVVTPLFVAHYPSLFEPKLNKLSGKTEYSVRAHFPKGADLSNLQNAIKEAVVKVWGDKPPKGLRNPLRDQGELMREDGSMPEGCEPGAFFLNLKSKDQPGLVDQNREPIIDSQMIYGGVWLRASVNAYAYDHAGNRGVSFGLNHIQKCKDAPSVGGGKGRPQDAFGMFDDGTPGGKKPVTSDDMFS